MIDDDWHKRFVSPPDPAPPRPMGWWRATPLPWWADITLVFVWASAFVALMLWTYR